MFQPSFAAEDVPYRSLPTMSRDILQAMMPGVHIYEADMGTGLGYAIDVLQSWVTF
jgi:hypothetical protein